MKAVIWKSLAFAAGGLARGTLGMGFQDLMSLGCPIVRRVDGSPNLSLTFDDSPNAETTIPILECLAEHSVTATFFVIGSQVRRHPEIFHRIVAEGHEIANHTERHLNLHKVLPGTLTKEIVDCQQTILDFGAPRATLFRAPFGLFRADMRDRSKLAGITQLVGWDVTPAISETDPAVIAADVLNSARRGSIVLLHDGLIGTPVALSRSVGLGVAKSLRTIIPAILDRGIGIVPAGELIAAHASVSSA